MDSPIPYGKTKSAWSAEDAVCADGSRLWWNAALHAWETDPFWVSGSNSPT